MAGGWWRAPRQFQLIFLGVMLLLSATLGWLAWRLLSQDERLAAQQAVEQREAAADLVVAALDRRLSGIEQDLDRLLATGETTIAPRLEDDALVVSFTGPTEVRVWPERALIYQPAPTTDIQPPSSLFETADDLEFKHQDYRGAIAALRAASTSSIPDVRAAALVRIARNHLKAGQPAESLSAYERLSTVSTSRVGGMPAPLAADWGRLSILESQNDRTSLVAAAQTLAADLASGRWTIGFGTYQFLSAEAARTLHETRHAGSSREALAEAVASLWAQWTSESSQRGRAGRAGLASSSGPVLVVWRTSGNKLAALVAHINYLERRWLADLNPLVAAREATLVLTSTDGRTVLGDAAPSAGRAATRLASSTELPWTVQVFSAGRQDGRLGARRRLLLTGMAMLLALVLTGGWFVGHAVSRELAVARLQSDFVAAVSHEFRTPLTTLCQLSELLMRGRVSEEDRRQYYEFLHGESRRLRRLVEALLDFGRLEAGTLQYRFEQVNIAAVLRESIDRFRERGDALGHRIELAVLADTPVVQADRDALRSVFMNLFENAAKYSPDCDTVWVELAPNGSQARITVRDRGVGIPARERRRIFDKFVRGEAAIERGIQGTGVGLAMVLHIVRAHRGTIELESEEGVGSTFTVVLPSVGDLQAERCL